MGRLSSCFHVASLVFLIAGTTKYPNQAMFWLASGSSTYQYIREILAGILITQIITRPPRKIWFRLLAGSLAVSIAAWADF